LASPLGIVIGFSLTSIMVQKKTWKWSFYIQSLGLVPSIIGFILIPSKYFEVENAQKYKNQINFEIIAKL
jgi:dipeptide/tripeptide permease